MRWRVRSRKARWGAGGTKLGAQQPVGQQLGDPLGVLDVGLAARHLLDVRGIDHQDSEAALQQVVDRLPELAGALHRDVGDLQAEQPGDQVEQLGGGRAERADMGGQRAVGADAAAQQTTTVFLWTSRPAQRVCTICMTTLQILSNPIALAGQMPVSTETNMRASRPRR